MAFKEEMDMGVNVSGDTARPRLWVFRAARTKRLGAGRSQYPQPGWAVLLLLLLATTCCSSKATADQPKRNLTVILAIGAAGNDDYGKLFRKEAEAWKEASAKAGVTCQIIGLDAESKGSTDATKLREQVGKAIALKDHSLWLVLIGHGTFDGREAKFNLRGPDVMATDVAEWLKSFTGELAVINTAPSSAPFVRALSGKDRVIISATKSADEVFYTRFGEFFAQAIGGLQEADLDRDGEVSLLEAFLWSSKRVDRFFETEGRIATEHSLLDDNGDGLGTRADWFEGLRAVKSAQDGSKPDGERARQIALVLNADDAKLTEEARKQRDDWERQVRELRAQKDKMEASAYYAKLEELLRKIARLYD